MNFEQKIELSKKQADLPRSVTNQSWRSPNCHLKLCHAKQRFGRLPHGSLGTSCQRRVQGDDVLVAFCSFCFGFGDPVVGLFGCKKIMEKSWNHVFEVVFYHEFSENILMKQEMFFWQSFSRRCLIDNPKLWHTLILLCFHFLVGSLVFSATTTKKGQTFHQWRQMFRYLCS